MSDVPMVDLVIEAHGTVTPPPEDPPEDDTPEEEGEDDE